MCVTESLQCVEVGGTEIGRYVLTDKVSSSHSFSSAYSSTGIFYIIKSHQILHISIENWQVKLILIKTSLQTRFQIPYVGRSLEQSVGNVNTIVIDTEKCISLNQVKSLSKCIQVCQSCPCFLSTAFTTMRFQYRL